jgi:hypothetical protein
MSISDVVEVSVSPTPGCAMALSTVPRLRMRQRYVWYQCKQVLLKGGAPAIFSLVRFRWSAI